MTQLEAATTELLSHYVAMCEVSEDWKRQAWRSANDLAAEYPNEFGSLPEMLKQAMLQRKEQP